MVLEHQRTYHHAFAYHKHTMLVSAINDFSKSTPRALRYHYDNDHKVFLHAELAVVIKLGTADCSNYDFVITRVDRHGRLANSKPCPGCIHMFRQIGFRNLFWTCDYDVFESVNYREL